MVESTLIHIPHASLYIPGDIKKEFLLTQEEIDTEHLHHCDRYTDDIYQYEGAGFHLNRVSRLVFDPERFRNDEDEVMAQYGMGAVYQQTLEGKLLRANLSESRREELLERFYDPYHEQLADKVDTRLRSFGSCLIIDAHSFPSVPLAFEKNKERPRPDICIGTDDYHTPDELADLTVSFISGQGYSVDINHPFSGTIVPMAFYQKDKRIRSLMIEINRKLYMDEKTGKKSVDYPVLKCFVHDLLGQIIHEK